MLHKVCIQKSVTPMGGSRARQHLHFCSISIKLRQDRNHKKTMASISFNTGEEYETDGKGADFLMRGAEIQQPSNLHSPPLSVTFTIYA